MRCSKAQEMLNRYLAGSCNPLESEAVAGHLAGCPGCAARLAELKDVNELLDLWQQESAPEDLLQSVMQSLRRQPQRQLEEQPVAGRTAMLIRHLAVAAILALAFTWGAGPWLANAEVVDANKLVSSYAGASDNVSKHTVSTAERVFSKLNYEEWLRR